MRDIGERKAAETIVAACDLPGPTYRHAALQLHGEEVARAYLALLDEREREAAEQAVAVDEEWLRSVGFIESVRSAVTLRLPADDDLFIWHEGGKWRPAFEQGFAGYIRLALCSTRGDVLRLLAALGINVERGGE